MNDRFEEFIKDNAEGFDILEPKEDLWAGIEKNLEQKKRHSWRFIASRAAAVAAIFLVSFVVQKTIFKGQFEMPKQEARVEIPELIEAETYYNNMIKAKLNQVKPMLNEHPYLAEALNSDLTELEGIYDDLKDDLKDDIANHEVLEEMIQNYRLRIQILEEMVGFAKQETKEDTVTKTKNTQYEL